MIRLAVLLAVLASPSASFADAKADAQVLIDKATEAFSQEKFAEAIDLLKDAYTLDPRPELLYALGQAHAGLGQCDKAKVYYDRFVESRPKDAATARDAIAACKDAPPPEPPKPEPPKPDPPKPAPPPPPPPPAAWYTDVIGVSLAGVGLIAAGFGGFQLMQASSDREAAEDAATFDDYFAQIDDAKRKRTLGAIVGISGGVLLVGGLLKIALTDRNRETVQVTPAPGGGAVTFTTRF